MAGQAIHRSVTSHDACFTGPLQSKGTTEVSRRSLPRGDDPARKDAGERLIRAVFVKDAMPKTNPDQTPRFPDSLAEYVRMQSSSKNARSIDPGACLR